MKKAGILISILLVLFMAFLITGCGATKETQNTSPSTMAVSSQEPTEGENLQVKTIGFSKWQYTN